MEESPKQYDVMEESPEQYDVTEESPEQYDVMEESPEQYDVMEESPEQYVMEESPKQCDVMEESPKQCDVMEESPKQYNASHLEVYLDAEKRLEEMSGMMMLLLENALKDKKINIETDMLIKKLSAGKPLECVDQGADLAERLTFRHTKLREKISHLYFVLEVVQQELRGCDSLSTHDKNLMMDFEALGTSLKDVERGIRKNGIKIDKKYPKKRKKDKEPSTSSDKEPSTSSDKEPSTSGDTESSTSSDTESSTYSEKGPIRERFISLYLESERRPAGDFKFYVDCTHFQANEVKTTIENEFIVVRAKHDVKNDAHGTIQREFTRRWRIPDDMDKKNIEAILRQNRILVIRAPRIISTITIPIKVENN